MIGFSTGIPAATAASKYKQALFSFAIFIRSDPEWAIISLLQNPDHGCGVFKKNLGRARP